MAQLYLRDVPSLRPPGSADLLQVLWCPFDHPALPRTAVFWRTAASVTDALTTPPEPPAIQSAGYLPQPCLLSPEVVTEYPHSEDLDDEVRRQMKTCHTWQVPAEPDEWDEEEPTPEDVYNSSLSVAPGWKVGGWTRWGLTDPHPRLCDACGTQMDSLLTIASSEWGETSKSWIPREDRGISRSRLDPYPAESTKVQIADGNNLHLYICPASLEHPHLALIQ
ncbi:non-ribosomal peptide synthetase [Streptomyces sp. NBC_01298]|uniref:non-ribosomal peptide synthetase n=1 Tax=Streptomyces sp. NBC_01298 TaxID=2903817 RepID=UPI002E1393D1